MGHMSEDRTKERVASTAWWPRWEQELSEYINTCERFQKEDRKHGKKYGLLQHIEEPKHPWRPSTWTGSQDLSQEAKKTSIPA
ncbi:hypothetical protein O181_040543 [Austropuccinia psidii MF-1]|uniref:Integrase zinc-binding domain-containing protein n=1 Tax=Austropuccinia psidii MF-1 TaxID=1389203 RepID=A0A9Q3HCY8_9BASI|nr:hypothetical protein [Austropuccinia psidii MF-1]